MRYLFLLSAASIALAAPAIAQTAPSGDSASRGQSTTNSQGDDIVITGIIETSEKDMLAGTSIVSGEELTRDLRPSIGETLAKQPGVSATSFGPSASRPILRGF